MIRGVLCDRRRRGIIYDVSYATHGECVAWRTRKRDTTQQSAVRRKAKRVLDDTAIRSKTTQCRLSLPLLAVGCVPVPGEGGGGPGREDLHHMYCGLARCALSFSPERAHLVRGTTSGRKQIAHVLRTFRRGNTRDTDTRDRRTMDGDLVSTVTSRFTATIGRTKGKFMIIIHTNSSTAVRRREKRVPKVKMSRWYTQLS